MNMLMNSSQGNSSMEIGGESENPNLDKDLQFHND